MIIKITNLEDLDRLKDLNIPQEIKDEIIEDVNDCFSHVVDKDDNVVTHLDEFEECSTNHHIYINPTKEDYEEIFYKMTSEVINEDIEFITKDENNLWFGIPILYDGNYEISWVIYFPIPINKYNEEDNNEKI